MGIRGVRERHLESIIHKTLCHTVLVSAHPRTLIQVVLQVTATPEGDSVSGKLPQADSVGNASSAIRGRFLIVKSRIYQSFRPYFRHQCWLYSPVRYL